MKFVVKRLCCGVVVARSGGSLGFHVSRRLSAIAEASWTGLFTSIPLAVLWRYVRADVWPPQFAKFQQEKENVQSVLCLAGYLAMQQVRG